VESVVLTKDQLFSFIRNLLRSVPVDEEWYRKTYPDVDEAIEEGRIASGREHFISSGYFEGRKAGRTVVDENFYLATYPDVAEGIEFGEIQSAQEHFETHGAEEGRLPYAL